MSELTPEFVSCEEKLAQMERDRDSLRAQLKETEAKYKYWHEIAIKLGAEYDLKKQENRQLREALTQIRDNAPFAFREIAQQALNPQPKRDGFRVSE